MTPSGEYTCFQVYLVNLLKGRSTSGEAPVSRPGLYPVLQYNFMMKWLQTLYSNFVMLDFYFSGVSEALDNPVTLSVDFTGLVKELLLMF